MLKSETNSKLALCATGVSGKWQVASAKACAAPRNSRLAPRASRSGLSLIEVLISMFVLLFGLMGVAAIFPVGSHYAVRGEQFDRGATMAQTAFEEIRARGMLRPDLWVYPGQTIANYIPVIQQPGSATSGTFTIPLPPSPGDPHPGHAFVIDPMGIGESVDANGNVDPPSVFFPYGGGMGNNPWIGTSATRPIPLWGQQWPIRRITFTTPNPGAGGLMQMPAFVAESIFRLHDDVAIQLPEQSDRPGIQRWTAVDPNNTPDLAADDVPLARAYTGNYSWLATVVPATPSALAALQPAHAEYGNRYYDVSVAVFHGRDTVPSQASERLVSAVLLLGGEVQFYVDGATSASQLDAAMDGLRPGNWIALAGVNPGNGAFLLKWYKLLSLDVESLQDNVPGQAQPQYVRRAMVDGPDWPASQIQTDIGFVSELHGIILPGVIGVATQPLKMEQR